MENSLCGSWVQSGTPDIVEVSRYIVKETRRQDSAGYSPASACVGRVARPVSTATGAWKRGFDSSITALVSYKKHPDDVMHTNVCKYLYFKRISASENC